MAFMVCDKCKAIVSDNGASPLCPTGDGTPLRKFTSEKEALDHIATLK